MKAEILSIGNEVVGGATPDTNAAWLSAMLEDLGATVVAHRAVRDVEDEIVAALEAACSSARIVTVTGGLGPTADDLTREAAARFMGCELIADERAAEQLREFFARRARTPHPANMKQASLPSGAELLPNRRGTASGFAVRRGEAALFFMPGVPREMKGMFEEEVAPRLRKLLSHAANVQRTIVAVGLPESELGARLADLMARGLNPEVGTMVTSGVIRVRIVGRGTDAASVKKKVDDVAKQVRSLLGDHVIGEGDATLQTAVAELLERTGRTIAVAESCTGGLIAGALTEVPGISRFFLEGVVTYSNAAKNRLLGVSEELLERHGSVSVEAAAAMAAGVRERADADIGLAVTGIAGPGGGTADKPIGMVCFALSDNKHVASMVERFGGNRAEIRERAVRAALNMVRLRLMGG